MDTIDDIGRRAAAAIRAAADTVTDAEVDALLESLTAAAAPQRTTSRRGQADRPAAGRCSEPPPRCRQQSSPAPLWSPPANASGRWCLPERRAQPCAHGAARHGGAAHHAGDIGPHPEHTGRDVAAQHRRRPVRQLQGPTALPRTPDHRRRRADRCGARQRDRGDGVGRRRPRRHERDDRAVGRDHAGRRAASRLLRSRAGSCSPPDRVRCCTPLATGVDQTNQSPRQSSRCRLLRGSDRAGRRDHARRRERDDRAASRLGRPRPARHRGPGGPPRAARPLCRCRGCAVAVRSACDARVPQGRRHGHQPRRHDVLAPARSNERRARAAASSARRPRRRPAATVWWGAIGPPSGTGDEPPGSMPVIAFPRA